MLPLLPPTPGLPTLGVLLSPPSPPAPPGALPLSHAELLPRPSPAHLGPGEGAGPKAARQPPPAGSFLQQRQALGRHDGASGFCVPTSAFVGPLLPCPARFRVRRRSRSGCRKVRVREQVQSPADCTGPESPGWACCPSSRPTAAPLPVSHVCTQQNRAGTFSPQWGISTSVIRHFLWSGCVALGVNARPFHPLRPRW